MAKPHILIVEDDAALRMTLEEKLKNEGFDVSVCGKGNEAFDVVNRTHPDAVILDIILPNKSGWEILKDIKEDNDTKDIPVIIVSNFGTESSSIQAREHKAFDFVTKSNISLEDLVKKIKKAIADPSI